VTRSIRRRLLVLFVGFTAVLSLCSVAAILMVYHRVEDRLIRQRLEEAISPDAELGSMVYVGPLGDTPPPYRSLLTEANRPGRLEWELEGREAHALVSVELGTGAKRVAIYTLHEAERRERFYESALWVLFLLASIVAMLLARYLAVRAVTPIERLTRRVSDGGLASLADGELATGLDDDEVGLLARALDDAGNRLQASVERERRFLREASHELRTPVTVIQGAYDLIAESLDVDDVENHRRLERIGRSLRRIDLSLSSLLVMARAEHGAHVETFAFEEVMTDVIEEARAIAPSAVSVSMAIRGTPEPAAAQPLLAVALSNLLRNAVENTEQGEATVEIDRERAVVLDTGSGFPTGLLEREGAGPPPGYGLGIGTVDRICKRYGWSLHLENRRDDRGARVRLEFMRSSP